MKFVLPLPFSPMIQNTLLDTDTGNDLPSEFTKILSLGLTSTSKSFLDPFFIVNL